MLVYYALNGLHLSVKESLVLHRDNSREEDIRCLRQGALIAKPKSDLGLNTSEIWKDCIPEMPLNRTRIRGKKVVDKTGDDTH